MQTIIINNFGQVEKATIDLDKNIIAIISTQASGKSMICKVIYFCKIIRDYVLDFLMDTEQFSGNSQNEYFNSCMKYLKKRFMGCFGKTTHMQRFFDYL